MRAKKVESIKLLSLLRAVSKYICYAVRQHENVAEWELTPALMHDNSWVWLPIFSLFALGSFTNCTCRKSYETISERYRYSDKVYWLM